MPHSILSWLDELGGLSEGVGEHALMEEQPVVYPRAGSVWIWVSAGIGALALSFMSGLPHVYTIQD